MADGKLQDHLATPHDPALDTIVELFEHLEQHLTGLSKSVDGLSAEMRTLRGQTEQVAQQIADVSDHVEAGAPSAAETAAHEACPECGVSVVYDEAVGGWSAMCRACGWTDFYDDPSHVNPPPHKMAAASFVLAGAMGGLRS